MERAQSTALLKRGWMLVALFVLSFPIMHLLHKLKIKCFGDRDMEGGEWGAKIDRRNRRFHRRRIEGKRKARLKDLGIVIPPLDNVRNEKYLTITSDILGKRAERKRRLQEAERFVEKRRTHCLSESARSQDDSVLSIPPHILQANYGAWFRPREGTSMPIIPFEEHDMRVLISDTFPELMILYQKSSVEEQLLLWSLCALYKYGGHVFGSRESHVGWLVEGITKTHDSCQDVAVAKFHKGADHQLHLLMLASSPRHPLLKCAIHKLETTKNACSIDSIVESLFSPENWKSSTVRIAVESNDNMPMSLDTMCSQCSARQPASCCNRVKLNTCKKLDSKDKEGKIEAWTFVGVHPRRELRIREGRNEVERGSLSRLTDVTISKRSDIPAPILRPKSSIREVMKASNCGAGWWCHRCLHNPLYGTYESCSSVCNDCFIDLICSDKDEPLRTEIVVDVTVLGAGNLRSGEQRIPRVVHQTWPEELSVDRYPQLSRVQSSWKNAGWEYRFYTDNDARDYIARNFPSRFLDAYDSLVPGAFKVCRS
jgi:hypothetical protein